MNRRSLLDYLAENDDSGARNDAPQAAESLALRLAELEARLSAAARPEEPALPDQAFSSQIESILRRAQGQVQEKRAEPQAAMSPPMRRSARTEIPAPPLAAELPPPTEHSAEFTKFVEAVHLIGRAANRFLQEPPRQPPAAREPAGPSQDTLMLTAALKETIAAFQAMTSNLATAAGEIRHAADTPKAAPPVIEPARPRRLPREESDLFRLQDELDDLRERLAAMTRRKSRDTY
jgi:hypothetical protein